MTWGLLLLGASCSADGPAIAFQEFYTSQGTEELVTEGCMLTSEGLSSSSASAGGGPVSRQPYSTEYLGRDHGMTVIVRDGTGVERAHRDYSEEFLRSGASDDVLVDLAEDTLRVHVTGAEDCNP